MSLFLSLVCVCATYCPLSSAQSVENSHKQLPESNSTLFSQHIKPKKTFFGEKKRGWYWYEVTPTDKEIEKPEEKPMQAFQTPASPSLTPEEILKKQGEAWEKAKALAIVNPTPQNVRNYALINNQVVQQSNRFASMYGRVIETDPVLSQPINSPVNTQERNIAQYQNAVELESKLASIGQSHGLLYFFQSTCPYCKKFSPTLKKLSKQYGISIIATSLDGKGSSQFPTPKTDLALAQKLGVQKVPALYLVDPENNMVSAISHGLATEQTVKSQIFQALKEMEKKLNDDTKEQAVATYEYK